MNNIQQKVMVYSKDPTDHPLRYYRLLEEIEEKIKAYKLEEMIGAARIVKVISDFMWTAHFDHQIQLNQKSLVKTMDEISDILAERVHTSLVLEQQNLASSSKVTLDEARKNVSDSDCAH